MQKMARTGDEAHHSFTHHQPADHHGTLKMQPSARAAPSKVIFRPAVGVVAKNGKSCVVCMIIMAWYPL